MSTLSSKLAATAIHLTADAIKLAANEEKPHMNPISKRVAQTEYKNLPDVVTDVRYHANPKIHEAVRQSVAYETDDHRVLEFYKSAPSFTLLKSTTAAGMSGNYGGRSVLFSLPTENADGSWTPGEWHEVQGTVAMCQNGFHLSDTSNIDQWWSRGERLFVAETEGPVMGGGDKYVTRKVRLIREIINPGEFTDKLRGRERTPSVSNEEIIAQMPDEFRAWHPEVIADDADPLQLAIRAAAEARDLDAYQTADKARNTARQVTLLKIDIANLEGTDASALYERLNALAQTDAFTEQTLTDASLRVMAAHRYPNNRQAQEHETIRLSTLIALKRVEIQIAKILEPQAPSEFDWLVKH